MQFFEFASVHIPAIKFCFSTTEEYYEEATLLASHLQSAKTIAGTQKLHSFKPLSLNHLEVAQCDGLSLVDVKGYVTAIYDGHWWLAYVTDVIPADEEAKLKFLHLHRPTTSIFNHDTVTLFVFT